MNDEGVADKTILKLEEEITTSKELITSIEVKQSVREKELNDFKGNEMKTEDQMKLISIREKESNGMIRERDMKTAEHLEAVNSLKSYNTRLKNEMSDMRIVTRSAKVGLQEEKVKNDMKDCTIEDLNENVCRITEDKMKIRSEHHGEEISVTFDGTNVNVNGELFGVNKTVGGGTASVAVEAKSVDVNRAPVSTIFDGSTALMNGEVDVESEEGSTMVIDGEEISVTFDGKNVKVNGELF